MNLKSNSKAVLSKKIDPPIFFGIPLIFRKVPLIKEAFSLINFSRQMRAGDTISAAVLFCRYF